MAKGLITHARATGWLGKRSNNFLQQTQNAMINTMRKELEAMIGFELRENTSQTISMQNNKQKEIEAMIGYQQYQEAPVKGERMNENSANHKQELEAMLGI